MPGGDVAEVEHGSFVVGDDLDAECMGVVFMVVGAAVAQLAGDDRAVDDGLNSRVDVVDAWSRAVVVVVIARHTVEWEVRKNRAITRWGMFSSQ